ncbi:MAG: FAD:protein FMN transferase [Lachnospiraceae bacterium]|nr:FAD:protein FMN transferase [Lachnospiraceae bacterium]
MNRNRNHILAALAATALLLAAGCFWQYRTGEKLSLNGKTSFESPVSNEQTCTKQLFAMDTYMSFTAYGSNCEAAVDAAMDEVKRLDALLSTGSEDSEVSRINAAGGGSVSNDTAAILSEANKIYESTGGLFDYTIYPLMRLWGFSTKTYHVPSEAELADALALVDASGVQFDGKTLTLAEGQQIDFGGIAKGYTSNRVMEIYREYGITSGLVSLGGNVQTLNQKPDGTNWNIGIQDPKNSQGSTIAVVSVNNKAVVTSGGYERYFEEDGKTYIHILDPRTGYPADQDLISVSIISENGTLADALSTSLYIMGKEDAITYWKNRDEDFDMILVTEEGALYITPGIKDDFRTQEEVHVIV